MFKWFLLFILLNNWVMLTAQTNFDPPAIAPSFRATPTFESITLDGKLSESSWQLAEVVKDFFRMEPRQGGKYLYETEVRVLFDKRNLYFGVFCKDSVGRKGIRVQDYRRDFIYGDNDVFYLQLDPQNLKRYCVSFQTTPLGTQRDLQAFDDTNRDSDWDALWRVRTHVTDSGYYAEFAIPFKSLRYDKQTDSASWGVTFARMARRDYEVTAYPQIPQAYSPYRMTYAAQMKGLVLPPPSANIRIQPYGLVQYTKNRSATEQITESTEWKAGGEIKWAITPHSVLDVTFNTDFAQADVDRAVNNLTRFNVFFPERRQFFLENSGVYAGANIEGINPFFSRTIGLANSQFNAGSVPIDAGLRFTDRTQKRTWAGMYVRQRATDFQGAANFGVMRYLKNYGKQNNMGAMITHRLDETDPEKGLLQQQNTTVTVDGFIRPDDTWTIQYLASASRDNTNDSLGFAGSFYAGRFLPKWYYGWVSKVVSEKYVPGMGFVFAQNTIHHNPGGYFIWRPRKWKFIRRFDPGFFVNYYHDANDLSFQQADLYLFPIYTIFQDGSFFEYAITPTWQNINFNFNILGIPIAQATYYYTRHRLNYRTDQSKKIAMNGSYEFGDYYNGKLATTNVGARIAPIPNIAITFNYEYNDFAAVGSELRNQYTSLLTGGLRLAWDANIQAAVFYQYNSFNDQGRWNVRGSWQFAPLSFLYLVFNETNFTTSLERNQSAICKISYLKQF
ncbi:MAG: carbohydrate binding family 9 domain-containing protein [Cyclobacteriaceae bacterium]|nr:carbohydrate binding family 9 domain-containing protein [Cyclobacteriaceae bacterium]